jgi:hypothetical protein
LEEVLEEAMTEHLEASYRELTRRGEHNGHYTRNSSPRRVGRVAGGAPRSGGRVRH